MKTQDGFLAYVLDQLDGIDDVVSRPMFGGIGLYAGTVFFGIIFHDILYFKVDAQTRVEYRAGWDEALHAVCASHDDHAVLRSAGGRPGKRRGPDHMGAQGDRRSRAPLRRQQNSAPLRLCGEGITKRPCLTVETLRRKGFLQQALRHHTAVSATPAADLHDSRVISVGKDFDAQPSLEAA